MYRFLARATLKHAITKQNTGVYLNGTHAAYFSTTSTQNLGFFEQLKSKKEETDAVKKIDAEKVAAESETPLKSDAVEKSSILEAAAASLNESEGLKEEDSNESETAKSRVSNWRLEKLEALEAEEKAKALAEEQEKFMEYEAFAKAENENSVEFEEDNSDSAKLSENEKMAMIEDQLKIMEVEDYQHEESVESPILSEFGASGISIDEINHGVEEVVLDEINDGRYGHVEEEQVVDKIEVGNKMEIDDNVVFEVEDLSSQVDLLAGLTTKVCEIEEVRDVNKKPVIRKGKAWRDLKKVGVRKSLRSIGAAVPTKYLVTNTLRKVRRNPKKPKTKNTDQSSILQKSNNSNNKNNKHNNSTNKQPYQPAFEEAVHMSFLQPDKSKFLNATEYAKTLNNKFSGHGQVQDIQMSRRTVKDGILHEIKVFYKNPSNVAKCLEIFKSVTLDVQGRKIEVACNRDLSLISKEEKEFILEQRKQVKLEAKKAKWKADHEAKSESVSILDNELGVDSADQEVHASPVPIQKLETKSQQVSTNFVTPKKDEPVEVKQWKKVRGERKIRAPIYVLPNDLIEEPEKDQVLVDYISKFENKLSYFDHPSIMVEGRITTSLKENIKINKRNKSTSAAGYYFFMQAKPESPTMLLENNRQTVAGGIFKVFVSQEPKNFRRGGICKTMGPVRLSRDREQAHDFYKCSIEEAQVSMVIQEDKLNPVIQELEMAQAEGEKKIEEDPETMNPEKAAEKPVKKSVGLLDDDDWM